MNLFFYIALFILGTMFGSFASVIIYRLKSGEKGILNGRSHCSSCNKVLNVLELIPLFSWLVNKGKSVCCKKIVSKVYPILELSTGILFLAIGYFLIDKSLIFEFNTIEIAKLIFFLIIAFFTIIYIFYDILFLEIPDTILGIGIFFSFIIISLQTIIKDFQIIDNLPMYNFSLDMSVLIYAIILSFSILIGFYIIMFKELNEFIDIGILIVSILALYIFKVFYQIDLLDITIFNSIISALAIFIFFYLQIFVSKGKWMGGGDLRIAILVGLIMGASLSFSGMFLTYILGSIIGLGLIGYHRLSKKEDSLKIDSQIPFGPFIGIGFFIVILLQDQVLKCISIYL